MRNLVYCIGILNYDDSRLRKQVEELQTELAKRDESARNRNTRMFITGLVIGSIGTGASIIGVLLALKVI